MAKIPAFILLLISWSVLSSFIPPGEDHKDSGSQSLFRIGRSKDANQIIYEINLDEKGDLDPDSPVRIYWIKYTKGGQVEPLSFIQRKLAYGIQFEHVSDKEAAFHFVSYRERTFWISRKKDNRYCVNTVSRNRKVVVRRIFVQIDGGTFMFPEISRVELHGEDPETGEMTLETIIP